MIKIRWPRLAAACLLSCGFLAHAAAPPALEAEREAAFKAAQAQYESARAQSDVQELAR